MAPLALASWASHFVLIYTAVCCRLQASDALDEINDEQQRGARSSACPTVGCAAGM